MNPLRMTSATVRVAGHRGYSLAAPENTLAAFRKAREYGGYGVTCETDLGLTRDGVLIIMHDKTLDRTTGVQGFAESFNYEEISRLDAGSWFSAQYAAEPIPRLRDALVLAREFGIIYQLKITTYQRNDELFSKLAALVDELKCDDLLQFSSFNFHLLKDLKDAFPQIPTVGVTHTRWIDSIAICRQSRLDALSIELENFSIEEARRLHEADFAVVLGIPKPEYLQQLAKHGLDYHPQIVDWVAEGLLDQVQCDDVSYMAAIMQEFKRR